MRLRHRLECTYTCTGGVEETSAQLIGEGLGNPTNCLSSLPLETYYIYDGWRVIQERDGTGAPTVSYARGSDLSGTLQGAGGIGGLLARSSGYSSGNWTTHNFYHADGNGNITYLVNSSQGLAASYRYDPFGNTISSSGTLASANVYRFSSKEIHAASGMYYYGYRFYDPNLQRWINRDPLAEWASLNLYNFIANDPISMIDSLGLDVTFSGDPKSQACLRMAYDVVKSTSPGKKLAEKLEKPGATYTIQPGTGEAKYDPTTKTITIDPKFHPTVDTKDGPQPASTTIILGHEMGHATGDKDDGPGNMNNVNNNENPIRKALKQPARTGY
jgi:RHS repeat-associated protein